MRITKKLEKRLNQELCMNDVLYEIHRRHWAELAKKEASLARRYKRLQSVNTRDKDGNLRRLEVLSVHSKDDGLVIEVKI